MKVRTKTVNTVKNAGSPAARQIRAVTKYPATAPEKVTARIPQAARAKAKVSESTGRRRGKIMGPKAKRLLQGRLGSQQLAIAKVSIRKFPGAKRANWRHSTR